jgi:serine/threonine protein kinase
MSKNKLISDRYKYINKIAAGSFGEVFLAQDKYNKKIFAAKIESKNTKSRLPEEYYIYKKLVKRGLKLGIPKIINFIQTAKQNILIMQLLGKDLDEIHKDFGSKFNIGTVLKIGIEIVTLLENLHKVGFVHRDIKPNNFLTGYKEDNDNLYVMDFGLSKQFLTKGKHIKLKVERDLVGTARYASINIHLGFEPSRRDDLESVGYMLVYFLSGKLPWQGLKEKKNEDKIKLIGDTKMYTNLKKLCGQYPICFTEYIKYCRNLRFDEVPDYEYLKKLFLNESVQNNIRLEYCWTKVVPKSEQINNFIC